MKSSILREKLKGLFNNDRVAELLSPQFRSYYREFFTHRVSEDIYIRKVERIMRAVRGGGKRIMDIGCGHGLLTLLLKISGAAEVHGVDYGDEKIPTAVKLRQLLDVDGVHFHRADGHNLPFHDGSFDVVICTAALSHARDFRLFLGSIARSLKRGGVFYLYEDNNSSFPFYYSYTEKIWIAAETGDLVRGMKKTHVPTIPYRTMRMEMIRKKYPNLAVDELAHCARETAGMYGGAIYRAVEEFRSEGRITNRERFKCRDPIHGETMEYPFKPFQLLAEIEGKGMTGRFYNPVFPPYAGFRGMVKYLVGRVYDIFPVLSVWTSPVFVVVARKS